MQSQPRTSLAENLQRRLHAEENAEKKDGHLNHRPVAKLIRVADFMAAQQQRGGDQSQEDDLAQVDPRMPRRARQRLARIEQGDAGHRSRQEQSVGPNAVKTQAMHSCAVPGEGLGRLAAIVPEAVEEVIKCDQEEVDKQPFPPKDERPKKCTPVR